MSVQKQNFDNLRVFLQQLKAYLDEKHIAPPYYLILDGHPTHTAKSSRKIYAPFQVLRLPAYSSYLSSVETLWSVFKQRFQ